MPEDVIINCSKGSKVPVPPPTRKWHSIQHDNTVTWLASWTEIVTGSNKYIMLNPSSKLKVKKFSISSYRRLGGNILLHNVQDEKYVVAF